MEITLLQGIIITLVVMVLVIDRHLEALFIFRPIIVCPIVGAILGDLNTGLVAGGMVELAFAGIAGIGGASVPEALLTSVMTVVFAHITGNNVATSLALAYPFGVLLQFLWTVRNTAFVSFNGVAERYAKEENMGGMAYVALSANGAKGIAKYLSEEKMAELKQTFGVTEGDAVLFMGGNVKVLNKFAGKVRNKLGEELGLFDYNSFKICWIVDFPMYEENEETGAVEFSHNPFSMPQGGLEALLNKNPLEILAYQYDLVCNGVELASGAVRNHQPEIMYKAFEIAGYNNSVVDNKFGGMINAFKYGAPPHAGCAPGIDRTVMLLLDEPIIRDVIIFPLNGKAQDLMMQAPNTVTEEQLKELHIKLDLDEK